MMAENKYYENIKKTIFMTIKCKGTSLFYILLNELIEVAES